MSMMMKRKAVKMQILDLQPSSKRMIGTDRHKDKCMTNTETDEQTDRQTPIIFSKHTLSDDILIQEV